MSTDGRARYVKLATDMLKQLPTGIFQQMMMEELAKRARIDVEQLMPRPVTTAKPPVKKPASLKARSPSTLRLAMTLLIQQPSLVELITEPLIPVDINGFDLLMQVIEKAKQNPQITAGGLLEHWRDQPERPLLEKLMAAEHVTPEAGIQDEFLGAIKQLRKLAQENLIENLIAKAAQIGLSSEEKQNLTELIGNKN
jgi:DNA primase